MSHDIYPEPQSIGSTIRSALLEFEGRPLDDALLVQMARTLNKKLASTHHGQRIQILRDGPAGLRAVVFEGAQELKPEHPDAAAAGLDAVKAALAA